MELGLSLGDASKSLGFLKERNSPNQQRNPSSKMKGLDFCMSLGVGSKNQERGKAPENDDGEGDGDDEEDDSSGGDGSDDNQPLQLNLLPLAPVPRQISSRLWSSDNGSFRFI